MLSDAREHSSVSVKVVRGAGIAFQLLPARSVGPRHIFLRVSPFATARPALVDGSRPELVGGFFFGGRCFGSLKQTGHKVFIGADLEVGAQLSGTRTAILYAPLRPAGV